MDAKNVMALDVGSRRIGVALASSIAKLPHPLETIDTANFFGRLNELIEQEKVGTIVVGRPRNLSGSETEQTKLVEHFVLDLKSKTSLPIYEQDEAVTSVQAENELKARGKPYNKEDIDSLAATYILEDYLNLL